MAEKNQLFRKLKKWLQLLPVLMAVISFEKLKVNHISISNTETVENDIPERSSMISVRWCIFYKQGSANSMTGIKNGRQEVGGWEWGTRRRRYMCSYDWFLILFNRNQHNIVKQLSSNWKKKKVMFLILAEWWGLGDCIDHVFHFLHFDFFVVILVFFVLFFFFFKFLAMLGLHCGIRAFCSWSKWA